MKSTIETSRGPVRFHSVGAPIVGIPTQYVKFRFKSKLGATAGLVMALGKFERSNVSELSRLFPYSEALKMAVWQVSPAFDSWDSAFSFTFQD